MAPVFAREGRLGVARPPTGARRWRRASAALRGGVLESGREANTSLPHPVRLAVMPSPMRLFSIFRARRAFTMIELLVIVVLLGVLAGVILPRVSAGNNRRGEVEAEAARTLLTRFAEKDAFSSAPLAIVFGQAPGGTTTGAGSGSGSRSGGLPTYRLTLEGKRTGEDEADVWSKALLVQPVVFSSLRLSGAATDAGYLPAGGWRVEFSGGEPRQRISLCLASASAGASSVSGWQVDLLPGELFARKAFLPDIRAWNPSASGSIQGGGGGGGGGTVDLDAQGQRTTAW